MRPYSKVPSGATPRLPPVIVGVAFLLQAGVRFTAPAGRGKLKNERSRHAAEFKETPRMYWFLRNEDGTVSFLGRKSQLVTGKMAMGFGPRRIHAGEVLCLEWVEGKTFQFVLSAEAKADRVAKRKPARPPESKPAEAA